MSYKKFISNDKTILLKYSEGYSSVIIPTKNNKHALCVSSQIGCTCKCKICHTKGFSRNLESSEIVDQFLNARREVGDITSIVFMGMGEPMLNIENVEKAIEILNQEYGFSRKKITLSTIGINLEKLKDKIYNIAISLHSPNDGKRKELLPAASSIHEIVKFTHEYSHKKQGVMVAYALIEGVNDSDEDLTELLSLDWAKNINFNLIEFNDIDDYKKSSKLEYFKEKIIEKGYKCFIRESRGKDINAACGMLDFS